MATKRNQKNVIIKAADQLKVQANNAHDVTLEVTESLVDVSLEAGKKWQGLFAKVLKQSTVIFDQQQDLVLTTLEGVKGQYKHGIKRMKKLLEIKKAPVVNIDTDIEVKATASKAKKAVKKTAKKVTKKVTAKKVAPKKASVVKEDLKVIEGIGPKLESILYKAGIQTYKQLATTNIAALKEILASAGPRFKNYNPTTWKKQARLAAAGKWNELIDFQVTIKGGKVVSK